MANIIMDIAFLKGQFPLQITDDIIAFKSTIKNMPCELYPGDTIELNGKDLYSVIGQRLVDDGVNLRITARKIKL